MYFIRGCSGPKRKLFTFPFLSLLTETFNISLGAVVELSNVLYVNNLVLDLCFNLINESPYLPTKKNVRVKPSNLFIYKQKKKHEIF